MQQTYIHIGYIGMPQSMTYTLVTNQNKTPQ